MKFYRILKRHERRCALFSDWVCSFIARHGGVCLSGVHAYIHFERHVLFKNITKIPSLIRARNCKSRKNCQIKKKNVMTLKLIM